MRGKGGTAWAFSRAAPAVLAGLLVAGTAPASADYESGPQGDRAQ